MTVHEVAGGLHERGDLVARALLVATAKVLAGILGDPDGATKGVVVVLDVRNELLSIGTIPVSGNEIDAATTALTDELLEPGPARRCVGGGWGTKGVTLGLERLNVLLPELNTTSRADV